MKLKNILNLALLFFFFFTLHTTGFGQENIFEHRELTTFDTGRAIPNEVIIKFKKRVLRDKIHEFNKLHGTSTLAFGPHDTFIHLRIPLHKSIAQTLEDLRKNPDIEYVEPNYEVYALMTPNDPLYSYQWDFNNATNGGIHMESAWDFSTGNAGVVVAVVDTGVAYENYGTFTKAPDLYNTNFVSGYNFVSNTTHANDDNSHGTHVTGTIAQSTNNAAGVAGIAFQTSIMPVKVLDRYGSGSTTAVANGIYFAADNGAKVINLSLGSPSASTTLENALAYAYNKGVTIVCAAGNEYQSGNAPSYPAAYNSYCIAVGATRFDRTRSYYSNSGSYLDLAAPGGDTNVDQNNDGYVDGILQQTFNPNTKKTSDFGYWFFQGTSMATPHVAGVAALLIAKGVTGPDQVRQALQTTAEDLGPAGWDPEYGWGHLNAQGALQYVTAPVHDVAATQISAPQAGMPGDTIPIVVKAANQGGFAEDFAVTLYDKTDMTQIDSQYVSLPAQGTADLTFSWDTTNSSIGNHILSAEASTVPGETNTANNTISRYINIQEPVHDVAVSAVNAPAQVPQGNPVTVQVTAVNQGTFTETATVNLQDQTSNSPIGSAQTVTLSAGASTQASFDWNTASAVPGTHILAATISTVSGETDTSDNTMTTSVTINPKPSNVIYVSDISMALSTRSIGSNRYTKAQATVSVLNGNTPVSNALVKGSWSGATTDTDKVYTDSSGKAVISSNQIKAASGAKFTFTVTSVSKSGLIYDPASNIQTSNSITVP